MQEPQKTPELPHPINPDCDAPFAFYAGRVVSRGNLWADVAKLAARLPDRPFMFNLTESRYLFCVSLLAALTRNQICLLPPSSQEAVIREILQDYPGAYIASEQAPQQGDLEWFEVQAPNSTAKAPEEDLDLKRDAVITFTSGSTGKPKPCAHSLATFKISAQMAVHSLGLEQQVLLMVSTTPPQHMFGLETSVFWPLFSHLLLNDGRPFFAEDIKQSIETAPWPAILTSTPTHLRSMLQTAGPWRNLVNILSATDTLSEKLAHDIVAILGQSPREIYGSTETLSFACRETLSGSLWQPYAKVRLIEDEHGQTRLESPHLASPAILQDRFQIEADGRFSVLGRHGDMVKISGKRASLSELNRRLRDIDGVEDGFCFTLDDGRLAAVVVGHLDKQTIRQGLAPYLDPVFLPRKIHFVAELPRNATGKLTKAELEQLLGRLV